MAKVYGFGKSETQRIVNGIRRVESMPLARAPGARGEGRMPHIEMFLAKITGNASLATNRFKYAWTEVLLNGDAVATRTGGRSGTTSAGYAINLAEIDNDSSYAAGVALGGTDYPAGFDVKPIGGGGTDATHRTDVVVPLFQITDINGTTKYVFSLQNSHDGTCA